MIELSVTLGIIISLFFIEKFGMAAGGIIVPGYVALQLATIDRLVGLIIIAFITFLIIKFISRFTFLFGRRQMVVSLLIGTILSIVSHHFLVFNTPSSTVELSAIGWVIPGLIAHWAAKQGFAKTMAMLTVTSVIVRLLVIICFLGETLPELY
ncbi:poly-gamma-glutamate biosynthesis protein PgsC [Seonamhaeicola sp.]|uniref:poly-gamma-glutamate biosynthesis protein PgsC n=1 Tax=Seonamhaeicola sp. TaxID=1912245 RepID=UPI00262CAC08|nr:poly-gamma-glutamate biosynthesis protein PgsC [Seonamhaeicola sp.]